MSRKQPTLAVLFVTASMLTLTSCATTTDFAGTTDASVACLSFEPIRWSPQDTDQTIIQVKEHNAVWRALCGGKEP